MKSKKSNKLTDANTIASVYVNSISLRKSLMGIDKKAGRIKRNKKLQKKVSKNTHKRREYNMIDLTLNHHEIDDESEFNFTTTEGTLPPLERSSRGGSEIGDDAKAHERYSRSHERVRQPYNLQLKNIKDMRKTDHRKNDSSQENSLNISQNAISLVTGNISNNRSDLLNLKSEFSYETNKNVIKKGAKILKNTSLTSNAKGSLDPETFSKVKHNLQLRKFSKSDKKAVITVKKNEESNRSNSRKNRILSNSSSKSKLNLEEFTKMKYQNDTFKSVLTQVMTKFKNFKHQMSQAISSESGSSIVWTDKYGYGPNADPEQIKLGVPDTTDDKDKLIIQLRKQLTEKDLIIEKLRQQIDVQRMAN